MTPVRKEILEMLVAMSDLHPAMRFGQLVDNVAMWSYGPGPEAIWDVEDEQFLEGMKKHLQRHGIVVECANKPPCPTG